MKKLFGLLLCLFSATVFGQVYTPVIANYTITGKPIGPSQATPLDGRSMYYDQFNFVYRPYQNTAEILTFLPLAKYRWGNTIFIVDSGGVLNGNGTYTGGQNNFWMFRDGTADANLVELNLFGSSGACAGCLLASNNLSDVANVTTARTNLGLGTMAFQSIVAAGDLSGSWPNITVAKFNGQLPSFYLNYNNLFNTPTIPAQVNLIAGTGISITGAYPNLTITSTGNGFTTAGVDLIALSSSTVGLDTLHYRKVDTIYSVNDSLLTFLINGSPYNLSVKGGNHGGGGGTGSVTNVSGTNANGVTWTITNPTSTPNLTIALGAITPTTVNAITFAAIANGVTITGGSGTPHTLTFTANATIGGTNSGDVTLAGENYLTIAGQVITAHPINLSGSNVTGVLVSTSFPALTGDVTTSAGSTVTTIANSAVTNAKMANMANLTVKGNVSGGSAAPQDLTKTQLTTLINTFTTTLTGAVPAPTTVTGKVLSDAGTWVTNGTGNTNTNVGPGFRWAIPNTNQIKTFNPTLGLIADSTTIANTITLKVDTGVIQYRGFDTLYLQNVGPANSATVFPIGFSNLDTFKLKKLQAGANITFTQNADSSITITATGGGGAGITTVGLINSQAPSANGLVISGANIYAQYATPTVPGMIQATGPQTLGANLTLTVAPTFSSLTTNGGIVYLNGAGTVQQAGAGTNVQVLHGGTTPFMAGVNLLTDVINILPVTSGGTGTATPTLTAGANISITGTWPNQTIAATGVVTSITGSGGTTGLTLTVTSPFTTPTLTLGGIANVTAGGTGLASLTPYMPIVGGTTSTGNVQSVSNAASVGQVLTYQGASTVPIWTNAGAILSFNNGLTQNGFNTVQLGGSPLIQNTTIHGGGFSFTLDSVSIGKIIAVGSAGRGILQSGNGSYLIEGINDSSGAASGSSLINGSSGGASANASMGFFVQKGGGGSFAPKIQLTGSDSSLTLGARLITVSLDTSTIAPNSGILRIRWLTTSSDTTNNKPLGINVSTGVVSRMDGWPGGGGGGASFTRQPITSGTSGTVTGGKYIVTFNPASVIATYTLTLPASPSDMDEVEIEAGGTITGGAQVVTSLTISPNSGQTIHQKVTPLTIDDGEFIKYRYRTANTAWYRRN